MVSPRPTGVVRPVTPGQVFPANCRVANPVKAIARRAQEQIAEFYNSNGENMVDPDVLCGRIPGCGGADVAAPLFETPAATVPTDFGFVFP